MDAEEIDLLIVRYLTHRASDKELEELLAWISKDEDNKRIFRAMKDAYDLGRVETDLNESHTDAEWQRLLLRIRPAMKKATRTRRLVVTIMRYVAIFVFGLVCMKLIDLYRNHANHSKAPVAITRVETGKCERTKVILPDSSVVWLNACSSISYNSSYGNKTRDIELRGEAFFDVHPDKSTPFVVSDGDLRFRVTGTTFNVYSFEHENTVSLVLEKGGVVFEHDGYSATVSPGELIEFDKVSRRAIRKKVNTDFYTNWRSGELAFEKMTFAELALRLERNFNVTFVFRNEKVKDVTFGGTFRHYDSLATIMKVISTSTLIRYEIEKDIIYIN